MSRNCFWRSSVRATAPEANAAVASWYSSTSSSGDSVPIRIAPRALGARAVLCARAYAYGLAAAGEAGVNRAIEILRTDLDRTLRLLGCASVAELDRSYVNVPRNWDAN